MTKGGNGTRPSRGRALDRAEYVRRLLIAALIVILLVVAWMLLDLLLLLFGAVLMAVLAVGSAGQSVPQQCRQLDGFHASSPGLVRTEE